MAYDSRAVRVPKATKVMASFIADKSVRKQFIRDQVKILETEVRNRNARNRGAK